MKTLLLACLAIGGAATQSNNLFGAVKACPVAPAGIINGRYHYYCTTGDGTSDCRGGYTMGSDTRTHLLGCTGTTCTDPIITGNNEPPPPEGVHIPSLFSGATSDTFHPIGTHPHKTKVHSKISFLVRIGLVRKKFRVYLITHPDVKGTDGLPKPMMIAQEAAGSLASSIPYASSYAVGTCLPHTDCQAWKFNVPKIAFHGSWISSDSALKAKFNSTGSMSVAGITIVTPHIRAAFAANGGIQPFSAAGQPEGPIDLLQGETQRSSESGNSGIEATPLGTMSFSNATTYTNCAAPSCRGRRLRRRCR